MKQLLTYLIPVVALTLGACSKQAGAIDPDAATGSLSIRVSTRAEGADGDYDPTDHLTVRIYNESDELIRKYASKEELPERLELIAGQYRAAVEAGEAVEASFSQRFYKGEQSFEVTPGVNTPVEVKCTLQNTAVATLFEESVAANFGSAFEVRVMAGTSYDDSRADAASTLRYTSSTTGYFTLPEGVESLAWKFSGEHPSRGTIEQSGTISDVKAASRYTLTFRFSPDLPGFIEAVAIRVNDSTDDFDDTIIWSPDPTIEGDGFDLAEPQQYTGGEKRFLISTVKPTTSATLIFGEQRYDLLAEASTRATNGLTVVKTAENALTVTLAEEFFAGYAGGDHTLRFEVTDNGGGQGDAECIISLQGLATPTAADYDLWQNTVTLRARVFDPAAEVRFGLRTQDGEWLEMAGEDAGDGFRRATFGVEWEQSTNENGQTVYTPKAGTGIWAGCQYECRAVINGSESLATLTTAAGQTIPGGDMEDGSMSCFNNNHGSFWDSGNNSMSDPLCVQSSYNGMTGSACARLQANKPLAFVDLAAGNLFTGSFNQSGLGGTVSFGQPYDWQARPRMMRVRYYAESLGLVNQNQHTGPLAVGSQDQARIYAAIVDWNATHNVTSGSSSPSGVWDPAKGIYGGDNTTEASGRIIAYASLPIDQQSSGEEMITVELPFHYYDTSAKPSGKYTLVISCATSAYGDFMNGCTSNVLYVDDFQWVY